ncbi:hypothetical protein SARI_01706 [Salmonella enterica subsp. arizonae serovar 62:z4,z23:-]|uniref:Uncharacterized protein n=4 Tax=Salmonella enterica TaxID=28901 RepID=A9MFJ1_SALAR|nr:hypothetical protein SARI_01706 [Salmonella enterica subsp. arizonae serovar 62:z4,z23:-]
MSGNNGLPQNIWPFVVKGTLLFWRPLNSEGNSMRVGILFPIVIFITAILFLAWFFIGGYAAPGA